MVTSKRTTNRGHFQEPAHATQQPAPTERDQTRPWLGTVPQHHGRRRRTLSVGGGVVTIVVALLALWLVKPFITGTIDAGHGAICPECAVDQYIFYGPHNALGDDTLFRRILCAENREQLARTAHDFVATYRSELAKWKATPRLEPGRADSTDDGAQATVTAMIQHLHETGYGKITSRSSHQWIFRVVDEDGWRVCAVNHPDICRDLVNCAGRPDPLDSTPARPMATGDRRFWTVD